ncbi:hypothetical protein Tco_0018323 [Tanacetum coccineum]
MTTIAQRIALDNALVAPEQQRELAKYSRLRIDGTLPQKMETLSYINKLVGHSLWRDKVTSLIPLTHTNLHYAIAPTVAYKPPQSKDNSKTKSDSSISTETTLSKKTSLPNAKKMYTSPQEARYLNLTAPKKKHQLKDSRIKSKGLNVLHRTSTEDSMRLELRWRSGWRGCTAGCAGPPKRGNNSLRIGFDMKAYEGIGTKPGVPDVPKYDSESKKESWGDSREEDYDDEDDTEDESNNDCNDDDNGNDDDGDNDDNNDDSIDERTESDKDENPNLIQSNEEHEDEEEEYVDERVHTPKNHELTDEKDNAKEENKEEKYDAEELYKDVNVNLRKEDVEMTDVDQGGEDEHNVSQESGFEQVEEDAHVTLTAVHDT